MMMNRFDRFALVAVMLVTLLCAGSMAPIFQYYSDTLAPASLMMGIAGWLIATFGPLLVALWCWRKAKKMHAPWMPHLGMLAGAVVLLETGKSIMLAAMGAPNFDNMLGGPSNPPHFLFLLVIGGYFSGLAYQRISSVSGRR